MKIRFAYCKVQFIITALRGAQFSSFPVFQFCSVELKLAPNVPKKFKFGVLAPPTVAMHPRKPQPRTILRLVLTPTRPYSISLPTLTSPPPTSQNLNLNHNQNDHPPTSLPLHTKPPRRPRQIPPPSSHSRHQHPRHSTSPYPKPHFTPPLDPRSPIPLRYRPTPTTPPPMDLSRHPTSHRKRSPSRRIGSRSRRSR